MHAACVPPWGVVLQICARQPPPREGYNYYCYLGNITVEELMLPR